MADKTSDRPNRVAAAASRLRLLQVDLADKSPEARMHYLAEEIQRAAELYLGSGVHLAAVVLPE